MTNSFGYILSLELEWVKTKVRTDLMKTRGEDFRKHVQHMTWIFTLHFWFMRPFFSLSVSCYVYEYSSQWNMHRRNWMTDLLINTSGHQIILMSLTSKGILHIFCFILQFLSRVICLDFLVDFLNLASCWLDLVKNSVTLVVDVTVTRQVFFALTYSLKLLPSSNVKQLHTKFASSFLFPFGIFS